MKELARKPPGGVRPRGEILPEPVPVGRKGRALAGASAEHDFPAERAGPQQKGNRRPAQRLPVRPPVGRGLRPDRPLFRRQRRGDGIGQNLVKRLFALDLPVAKAAHRRRNKRQQLPKGQPQRIERKGNAAGVNPGFLAGFGTQRGEEDIALLRWKHNRRAAVTPGLQQRLFLIQRRLHPGRRAGPHTVPQRSFKRAGRGVLHPAHPGRLRERPGRQRPGQVMRRQPVGPYLRRACCDCLFAHTNAPFWV